MLVDKFRGQEIVNMEPRLSMTFAPYYYGESELSDDENEHHINRVMVDKKDGDAELLDFVN
jgi:hypothetical protein